LLCRLFAKSGMVSIGMSAWGRKRRKHFAERASAYGQAPKVHGCPIRALSGRSSDVREGTKAEIQDCVATLRRIAAKGA
jgi:hypothetical protein